MEPLRCTFTIAIIILLAAVPYQESLAEKGKILGKDGKYHTYEEMAKKQAEKDKAKEDEAQKHKGKILGKDGKYHDYKDLPTKKK